MKTTINLKKIPVTALINILVRYENKNIRFVDLECISSDNGDQVGITKHKKDKKNKKEKDPNKKESLSERVTDATITELLKYS